VRRRDRLYAWIRAHPLVPDTALAALLFLMVGVPSGYRYADGTAHVILATVTALGLVFRRVRPVASFAVAAGCACVQWAAGIDLTPANALLLLAFYSISAYGPQWASRAGLGVGLLGAALAGARYIAPYSDLKSIVFSVVALSAFVVGAWALGDVRRVRQAYVAELVNRAQQAERERDQQAKIAVADERARIAREMHDVVAHNLSVIVVQADGGRYAAEQDPKAALQVLETIGDTGRGALADMRRLLGVLRAPEDSGELGPQPGLVLLPDLIASVRKAGLDVDFGVDGEPRALGAGASLAVYRAIQEGLTNTLKHAGPHARSRVRLAYDAERLTVEVSDDGPGASASSSAGGPGHGLIGMRERVEAFGGEVMAGPGPEGGWRIRLTMPYDDGK